jgi:chemotaxis protein CheX
VENAAAQDHANGQPEVAAVAGGPDLAVIALPRALDLAFAGDLLTAILARAGDRILTLDGSNVDYASTPCVQILLAAGRKRDATEGSLVIRHASEALRRAVDDFGLQPDFSRWMV